MPNKPFNIAYSPPRTIQRPKISKINKNDHIFHPSTSFANSTSMLNSSRTTSPDF